MVGIPSSLITEADLKAREVVPFQGKVFGDFVATIGRLFYDDGSIILMDCLARAQRALSENELKEKLRWRENLLHQKLYALEKQLLLERVCDLERSTSTRALSGNQRWRIHCHLFVAVEWRYNALISSIQEEVRRAAIRDDFECSNPSCKVKVDLIDAASGPKSLEDEHPLCRLCGSHLTTARSEEAKVKAEGLHKRTVTQLAKLKESLLRVKGMEIPAFTANGEPGSENRSSPTPPSSADSSVVLSKTLPSEEKGTSSSRVIPWFSSTGVTSSADRVQELLPNGSRISGGPLVPCPSGSSVSSTSMTFGTSTALGSSQFSSGGLNSSVLRSNSHQGSNTLSSVGGSQVNSNTAYSGNESEVSSRSAASSGRGWDGASSGSLASQAGRSPLKLTFGSSSSSSAVNKSTQSRLLSGQKTLLNGGVPMSSGVKTDHNNNSFAARKLLKVNFSSSSVAK